MTHKHLAKLSGFVVAVSLLPHSLFAASVGFSFSAADMGGAAASQVLYFGDITNNDSAPVYLTSENVSVNGFTIDYTPFTSSLAGPLAGFGDTGIASLFTVDVPNAVANPYGTFAGSYQLLGGANPGDNNLLASGSFLLQVVPTLPSSLLTLTPSEEAGTPGSTLTYSGTVVDAGPDPIFLNGANLNASGDLNGDTTPFLSSPLFLNPGTFEYNVPLFTVMIPSDAAQGPLPGGNLTLLGGADGGAQDVLGSANFSIIVTPEPGTCLLMAAGLATIAFRRRVKL